MTLSKAVVVGGGVCGLSCGILLLESGRFSTVQIISHTFPPDTTSDGAGALWCPATALTYCALRTVLTYCALRTVLTYCALRTVLTYCALRSHNYYDTRYATAPVMPLVPSMSALLL